MDRCKWNRYCVAGCQLHHSIDSYNNVWNHPWPISNRKQRERERERESEWLLANNKAIATQLKHFRTSKCLVIALSHSMSFLKFGWIHSSAFSFVWLSVSVSECINFIWNDHRFDYILKNDFWQIPLSICHMERSKTLEIIDVRLICFATIAPFS